MSHIRALYELRRFTRASDPDFQSALRLYTRIIGGPARTQSNEITFWLENYHRYQPDEFCVCGFYSNAAIIGYAEFAYFSSERMIAFDYLLLHEAHRNHGEFFQFVKLLKQWIEDQDWAVDYTTAEVVSDGTSPEEPCQLHELFGYVGFAAADTVYYQPNLGLNNPQSDIRAHLLVRASHRISSLPVAVFVKLAETVYFKHYERWYSEFVDAPANYQRLLKRRLNEIRADAERRKTIQLNGAKTTTAVAPSPPPPRSHRQRRYVNAVCAAAVVLGVCFCLLLFQKIFDRDLNTVLAYLSASLVVSAVAFAFFYQKGQWVLAELLKFLKPFDKRK